MDFNNIDVRKELLDSKLGNRPTDVSDSEWENHKIETAAALSDKHYLFSRDASKLLLRQLDKKISKTFSNMILSNEKFYQQRVIQFVARHAETLDIQIEQGSIFDELDFIGLKTLIKSYLLKDSNRNIIETPQYMLMRVAIGIHAPNLENVLSMYKNTSHGYYTHATPTLFNSGLLKSQLASCFLVSMREDSIEGIYDTLKHCAMISKHAGGIGLSIHDIRASGSNINGTNGTSNGIVPMLRVFNSTSQYVDQGGGKRKGAIAIYLEPWHLDIVQFLNLKQNIGAEETKARDLFYALWVPDLFMKRVIADDEWTLFCPTSVKGLSDLHSKEFEDVYIKYEQSNIGKKVKAREIWNLIIDCQIETGTPYILFKDACNQKSNQSNLGTIKSSNLCCEIVQYTSKTETAVCNLASVSLPKCIKDGEFDFEHLRQVVSEITGNLDKVIDESFYPVLEAKQSNMRHRPMGIGIQGLSDVYQILELPFESDKAAQLNKKIFENIYLAAVKKSIELAKKYGPYESFEGSPASKGILQFDHYEGVHLFYEKEWKDIKQELKKYGMRNSLLTCVMPTVSSAAILNNSESIEIPQSNIYSKRTGSGNFTILNKILVQKLESINMWNDDIQLQLVQNRGSIQNINEIPQDIKSIFKTCWEVKQRSVVNQASERAPFICQSQSMNLYFNEPNRGKISAAQIYAFKKGLKTGVYYTRTKMKSMPQATTSCRYNPSKNNGNSMKTIEESEGECMVCSS
jgi:ribonucleoside-diphosphate reductase alpha chain